MVTFKPLVWADRDNQIKRGSNSDLLPPPPPPRFNHCKCVHKKPLQSIVVRALKVE